MRVLALHEDVLVVTSAVWQTTCTIVRRGDEAFVVDSPVLPHELEALPALLQQAGWPFSGLLATHGDWDHLLGRPGQAQRRLRAFDEEHYVERERPLALGSVEALPVPGRLEVGGEELELHPTEGHVADGMAVLVPWARVLVAGDFLSPVEVPMLSDGGSRSAYLATLRALEPLLERVDRVVPGHGAVLDAARARAILREDVRYLETGELPLARRTAEQRRVHARNQERW